MVIYIYPELFQHEGEDGRKEERNNRTDICRAVEREKERKEINVT
jgi:hypothetical protein